MAYHSAVNGLNFDTPLALEVYCHRGLSRITGSVQVVHRALHDLGRHARRSLCHGSGFLHHGAIKPPRGFVRQELCWGQTGQGREATKGRNEHEFFPQAALDVGWYQRRNTSRCTQGPHTLNLFLFLSCQAAKLNETVGGGLFNHSRGHERRANASDSRQDSAASKRRLQLRCHVHAILERQYNSLCVDHGLEECCCRRRIIRFYAKEHNASRREFARVGTGLDRHRKIAIDAAHAQAAFLQRVQVGAASHERDIRTALGQKSTEIAPQTTTSHHDNTHRLRSSLASHQSSA